MGERMLTFEDVLESALALSPVEKVRLVERLAKTLEVELDAVPKKPKRSLLGLWADSGIAISEEDIAEARREMWSNFPREDIL